MDVDASSSSGTFGYHSGSRTEPLPPRRHDDDQQLDNTAAEQVPSQPVSSEPNQTHDAEQPRSEYGRISPSFQWGGESNPEPQISKEDDLIPEGSSQEADEASSSTDKGKTRAATVEDLNDDDMD
ncbi:hypothetical protein F66182_18162 [Fusarium sp. NRRL 66182]|nr:hypothetical protein F66182_18162 [Fusarium sp. NRRL 66182]